MIIVKVSIPHTRILLRIPNLSSGILLSLRVGDPMQRWPLASSTPQHFRQFVRDASVTFLFQCMLSPFQFRFLFSRRWCWAPDQVEMHESGFVGVRYESWNCDSEHGRLLTCFKGKTWKSSGFKDCCFFKHLYLWGGDYILTCLLVQRIQLLLISCLSHPTKNLLGIEFCSGMCSAFSAKSG